MVISLPEMNLTDFQKTIYNLYLAALAVRANRGYKNRENFDKIKEEDVKSLYKLSATMEKWDRNKIKKFFLYGMEFLETDFIPLYWFATSKAFKAFRIMKDNKELEADNEEVISSFIKGLKFIVDFCKRNKISLRDYSSAVNNSGSYWWFIHLCNNQITLYNCNLFDVNCDGIDDYCEIKIPNFYDKYEKVKVSYIQSKKLRSIGEEFRNSFIGGRLTPTSGQHKSETVKTV